MPRYPDRIASCCNTRVPYGCMCSCQKPDAGLIMHYAYVQGFADALRIFAELEAARRRERQADGIARARAAGGYKGGRPTLDREAIRRAHAKGLSPAEIARCVGCGRASVYRVLQADAAPA